MTDIAPYCIYHGNCYDGWGAAWVTKKAFPNAILLPAVHGQPIPDVPDGSFIFMIDISFPREEMEALRKRSFFLRVLDHHHTAQKNLEGFENALFDMSKSGAMLAWEEFNVNQDGEPLPAPPLIRYIQDGDLWQKTMPYTLEVQAYIRSFPREIGVWDKLHNDTLEANITLMDGTPAIHGIIDQGAAIIRNNSQRVAEMCEQAVYMVLGDYMVPIVNASSNFSEVGHWLCENLPCAFAGYYFDRGDHVRQWGLRSVGEFDVSEIAKLYGGGGHKNAAGFQTDRFFYPVRRQ